MFNITQEKVLGKLFFDYRVLFHLIYGRISIHCFNACPYA